MTPWPGATGAETLAQPPNRARLHSVAGSAATAVFSRTIYLMRTILRFIIARNRSRSIVSLPRLGNVGTLEQAACSEQVMRSPHAGSPSPSAELLGLEGLLNRLAVIHR